MIFHGFGPKFNLWQNGHHFECSDHDDYNNTNPSSSPHDLIPSPR